MIFIRTDILNPYNPKIVSQDNYSTLIKFLIKYFPSGFDRPVDISVNGFIIEVDAYDIELKDEDVIVLLDRSALPVGLIGGWFITALANLAISVTLSYVANKLFAPDEPEEQAKPSSVYTIATGQNTAKYGSPIPIVYGKVRMYPSMIVNPYYKIEDNIEYLYHIMCIGQGQYTTDSVMIGEDTITTAGDLQYKLMNKDTFYNIPLNAYGIHITRTLSSPSNLELKEGVLTERYNIKQGTDTVEFDYHYPNGIYATNSVGEYILGTAAFSYFIHSSTGVLLYTGRRQDYGITADPIQATVAKNVAAWTADDTITISFQQDVTPDDPGYSEKNYVKRVKEIYPNKDFTQLYGDITLLACKIKATNAVSSAGQVKVNGYFERTDVGNSMEEVLTDIYTNTNYGGALSVDDLDFPVTDATVDCAYESNQTIFDAMRKPALAQGYSVFLAGMDVMMKKDGVNTITSGMYNEQNILRDSLKVQYLFKEESPSYDGYETTYIDGDGFTPKTEIYPTNSIRPQKVDLFGVVDWGSGVPEPLACVKSAGPGFIRNTYKLSNGYYFQSVGGTSVQQYLYNPDFTLNGQVASANGLPTYGVVIGNNIYTYDYGNNRFRIYDPETQLTTYTVPDTRVTGVSGTVYQVSAWGTYICASYQQYQIDGGDFVPGYVLFDSLGQYVSSFSVGATTSGAYIINGSILKLDSKATYDGLSNSGGPIDRYDINGNFIDQIPRPTEAYTNGCYGNNIIDLGIENGQGRFIVSNGDYVNTNSGGFAYYTYRNGTQSFALYDYDFNLLASHTSPINGTTAGTWFGSSATRYGDFILVGEPGPFSYEGITNPGAVHLYDINGTYLKTFTGLEEEAVTINNQYGAGMFMDGTRIGSFGIGNTYRECAYEAAVAFDTAWDMAKYLYKQDDYRRKIVTFSTDIQGLVPQYLDKIMVSHSAVQWGEAGEVYGRTGDDLELSDPLVDLSAGQTIVFRDIDGSVSTAYAIIITDANNITVTGMPAWVTNNTFYTIQGMGTAREFLVISVKPSGETVSVDCVNYSPEIYE